MECSAFARAAPARAVASHRLSVRSSAGSQCPHLVPMQQRDLTSPARVALRYRRHSLATWPP